MSEQYLIISADGVQTCILLVDRDGLLRHLAEAGEFADEGGYGPTFLESIEADGYGSVRPGAWHEGTELIVKVQVVVPQPVTTKWSI